MGQEKILHGNIAGVCYNCLNGGHSICEYENCTCRKKDHKAWWWKTKQEIKAENRWDSVDCFVATCKAIDALSAGIKQVYPKRSPLFLSIEDINTLQDLLLEQGYSIQKIPNNAKEKDIIDTN